MINLNNKNYIQAEALDVINVLKDELEYKGINRFKIIRPGAVNIQTNCPFHKDGQERKPSFGIHTETGKCNCFTCGWKGDLSLMISNVYGRYDDGQFGLDWLVKRFNSLEVENRRFPQLKLRNSTNIQEPDKIVLETELERYRNIHSYMYKRGLTDEIIKRFDVGYDSETECITFPIRDLNGDCVFVARRSVNSKFFNYPSGVNKPVYLANEFTSGKYKSAYICESFLNALTCWKYEIPAMALMGTGNSKQYEILKSLPVREYVLAFDPDEAGERATERFRRNVTNKIIREIKYEEKDKDINDLQEKIKTLKKVL